MPVSPDSGPTGGERVYDTAVDETQNKENAREVRIMQK